MQHQKTLARSISYTGIGLHSGKDVTITLHPAEEHTGIVFKRVDLPSQPSVRAVAGNVSWMLFSGGAFVGVLIVGILSLMFPVLSRFENSFSGLQKNTFFLAMANLPRTIALGILNTAAALACAFYILPLFFLPSLAALIGSVLIEPMFKPYMPAENAAE